MFNKLFVLTLLRIGAVVVFVSAFRQPGFSMTGVILDIVYLGIWLQAEYEYMPDTKKTINMIVSKISRKDH